MTEIKATIIADSISSDGIRITTMHLRYPRFIHSEFLTHREFSRNARSSRAVPTKKLLMENIAEPVYWGVNKPGMQAGEELSGWRLIAAKAIWRSMATMTQIGVNMLSKIGLHKQHASRPLEWFGYIDTLVTSTSWANFMHLRDHPDAQPEIRELAVAIKTALNDSTPKKMDVGSWHMPYIEITDLLDVENMVKKMNLPPSQHNAEVRDTLLKLSVARCARISYRPFNGDADLGAEINRYHKLVGSVPLHASPAEHQATPDIKTAWGWQNPDLHGNLIGWQQYRKTLSGEYMPEKRYT